MFVNHQFHDLNVLQTSDGLPIDVCHKVALSQATLPCRSFLVHLLQRHNKGFDITYISFVQYTCILYNLLHTHVQTHSANAFMVTGSCLLCSVYTM